MAIQLDHTIVPSHDHDAAATFFAGMFGLPYEGPGHFAPVRVNEALTLDFANAENFDEHHYGFVVSEEEFNDIFARITQDGVTYGSGPFSTDDGEINTRRGGRGLYFRGGPDRHLWEIMTVRETAH